MEHWVKCFEEQINRFNLLKCFLADYRRVLKDRMNYQLQQYIKIIKKKKKENYELIFKLNFYIII